MVHVPYCCCHYLQFKTHSNFITHNSWRKSNTFSDCALLTCRTLHNNFLRDISKWYFSDVIMKLTKIL